MPADLLVVFLLVLFGCVAFVLGLGYIICLAIGGAWRGLMRLLLPHGHADPAGRPDGRRVLVCSRERCRKIEYRNGRYCSRCGAPLVEGAPAADTY